MTLDVSETVTNLLDRKTAFLDVVESLEDDLINTNVDNRQEAIKNLTAVLLQLPLDYLNEIEVSTLVRFFSARLSDSVLLTSSCLKALYYLSRCKKFTSNGVYSILSALFKEHMVQSLVQENRFLIFDLINFYLDNFSAIFKTFETEFILGYIQAVDGEKDPRNIMQIFHSFYKISTEFNFGSFAEDMFELISCYFPVDFKPPADDTSNITSEELSEKLHLCLTSNSAYAPYCYQLLDENFAEDKPESRLSILNLLLSALKNYSPDQTVQYALNIWRNLRHFMLNSDKNSEVERLTLECLRLLIISINKCTKEDGANSELSSILSQISNDCVQYLSNSEMQLIDVAIKLITTACDTNSNVCNRLAGRFLPLSLEKYQTQRVNKSDYAKLMLELMKLLNKFDISEPFLLVKDSIVTLLCDGILAENDQILLSIGFNTSTCILKLDNSAFSESQLSKIVTLAADFLDLDPQNDKENLRQNSIEFLQFLSNKQPNFVENFVQNSANSLFSKKFDKFLNLQAIFIVNPSKTSLFLPNLLNFDIKNLENLTAIRILIEEMAKKSDFSLIGSIWKPIFMKLFEIFEKIVDFETDFEEKLKNLNEISDVMQDLMLILDQNLESDLVEILLEFYHQGKFKDHYFSPISEKIVGATSENMANKIAAGCGRNLVDKFFDFYTNFDHKNSQFQIFGLSYARLLAIFSNKLNSDFPLFDVLLKEYLPFLEKNLHSENAIEYFACLTKALLLRNFQPLCNECLKKLVQMLNSDYSNQAEKALELIFIEQPRFLSRNLKTRFSFLYKQRIFTEFVSLVKAGFQECHSIDRKKHYFKILSVALSSIPQNAQLLPQVEELLPLLVNSIDSDDIDVLVASIGSLEQLLAGSSETVEKLHSHVPSICERLCKLAHSQKNMQARLASLKCLAKLAVVVNPVVLNPWRHNVIKLLSNCLDDPKRILRKAAVDCRNRWFLIA